MSIICPSPPPTPDYGAAATAQGAANRETAIAQSNLNNPNTYTPFGSQVWSGGQDGSRPTMTQSLSPTEQVALDQRNDIRGKTLDTVLNDMPFIQKALIGPYGLSGGPMGTLDPKYAPGAGDIQKDAGLGQAGPVQTGLNFSGAPAMPVASDQTRQAVADALYRQGSRYLDPQFAQQQDSLNTMLANQGITRGSAAQEREQGNLDRTKMQAYGNLGDQATQSGISAMNTLFNEQMGSRQQGVGETTTQGNFANSAQQQLVNDLLSSMSARNSAAGLGAQVAQASTNVANDARKQAYTEYATNRTMPINMLSGLLSQSQINTPQFQNTTPTSITPPPIFQGAVTQGQANAANASANSGLIGGLAQGAGAIMGGPFGAYAGKALFGG